MAAEKWMYHFPWDVEKCSVHQHGDNSAGKLVGGFT